MRRFALAKAVFITIVVVALLLGAANILGSQVSTRMCGPHIIGANGELTCTNR